jgi:hypothetical protein
MAGQLAPGQEQWLLGRLAHGMQGRMAPLVILGDGQGAILGQGGFEDLGLPSLPAKSAAQTDPLV